jgi:hypothetical protein
MLTDEVVRRIRRLRPDLEDGRWKGRDHAQLDVPSGEHGRVIHHNHWV